MTLARQRPFPAVLLDQSGTHLAEHLFHRAPVAQSPADQRR